MPHGLTFRAAARRVGCTHRAISEAIKHGRIKLQADGTVSPADVDAWHASRRARRGGARRNVSKRATAGVEKSMPVSTAPEPTGGYHDTPTRLVEEHQVPLDVATASSAIGMGAYDLARILAAAGLAADETILIVDRWTRWQRLGWVGGQGVADPISAIDAWPDPPGGGAWHEHPLFQGHPLSEADWRAIDTMRRKPAPASEPDP
jgi:hypothetical protein